MKKIGYQVAVLLPLLSLGWAVAHHLRLKSGFARIQHGVTWSEVVQAIGEPSHVIPCGSMGGNPPPGCVKEFSYLSVLAFMDVWVVSIDANDRVVRKLRYRSP